MICEKLKKNVKNKPLKTSATIFNEVLASDTPKTTRCRILKSISDVKSPVKKPVLTQRHRELRLEWARTYFQQNFSKVLFSDKTRASLDGPDNWQKGWVFKENKRPIKNFRQKQGGSIMIWAGIINDELVGPFRVPDGLKMTSKTYVKFLKEHFIPVYKNMNKNDFIFMQDNAPSHSAKFTKKFLKDSKINVMFWPPNSPDLNPIENFWSVLKQKLYQNGKKYKSKNELWENITKITSKMDRRAIKNLTDSVKKRIFDVVLKKGGYVDY